MINKKKLFLIGLVVFFASVDVLCYPVNFVQADSQEEIQDKLNDLEKQKKDAEKELQVAQSQYYRNQTRINATQSLINKLLADIASKETELKNLNDRTELNKKLLGEYVRQIYYLGQEDPVIRLSLWDGGLSDMTFDADSLVNIKSKIIATMQEINEAKGMTLQAQADLTEKKQDNQDVLQSQKAEQADVAADVQEKTLTLAQIQQKMSKLRSALSGFLGKSFSMEDVIEAVKFASSKTGVRKEFLFAVLDKETDLGRFTGGCTYDKSKMGSTNLSYFKDICSDLGYDYKKMKVSCPLSYGIGGAMGVAQFMPSTWMGYKDSIASKTGNSPADPWSLKDGIMGMALYLKNKGADSKSREYQAAAMYYCGSNWKRTVCKNYANTVISWSKGYDDYF